MEKILCALAIAFCCASVLAQSEDGPSSRIINGNLAANNGQFPYAVSLQQIPAGPNPPPPAANTLSPTRNHRCGGVLLTLQHVLTAASCLFENVNGNEQLIPTNTYRIFAGAILLSDDPATRIRSIANITIHPDYVLGPSHVNDIAIITLQQPYLNTTVGTIGIPSSNFNPADFTNCTVAGWGGMNFTTVASAQLRWTTKVIYNHNHCTSLYSTMSDAPNIFPSMICASSLDMLSASCTGDTGNALVCGNTLTGILFHYTGCQQMTSFPELYTRISNYTQWIRFTTDAGYSFTPGFFLIALAAIVHAIASKVVY